MSKTIRYGFILAQTKGFPVNYGWVKGAFDDEDTLQAQHLLKPEEVIFYVDAEEFTFEQAEAIADKKAQELFGADPGWLSEVTL